MANTVAVPTSWNLLELDEESDLHRHRLLNIEEKPFKRITKRLSTVSGLVAPVAQSSFAETAADNGVSDPIALDVAASDAAAAAAADQHALLEEDLALDFAAFDGSIARLQLLLDANARERDRYQAEQARILAESTAVRAHNVELRERLEAVRAALGRRRRFDELADKITANRTLRPRADQAVALRKLEEECAELEREKEAYGATWRERRDQFNRIMEEGMHLRRLIRDEKEEVDRREGMDEDDGEAGGDTGDTGDAGSRAGRPASGTATPMASNNNGTAQRGTPTREIPRPTSATAAAAITIVNGTDDRLGLLNAQLDDGQNGISRSGSRAPSERSAPPLEEEELEEGEHVEMEGVEQQQAADTQTTQDIHNTQNTQTVTETETPQITVDEPQNGDKMELDPSG